MLSYKKRKECRDSEQASGREDFAEHRHGSNGQNQTTAIADKRAIATAIPIGVVVKYAIIEATKKPAREASRPLNGVRNPISGCLLRYICRRKLYRVWVHVRATTAYTFHVMLFFA